MPRKLKEAKVEKPPLRLVYVSPDQLTENPANWRTHPPQQLEALEEVMGRVGWAGACLYNERTGRLIDGHARKKIAKDGQPVPVLVGSWTEKQERMVLATLDPLTSMAEADAEALKSLLSTVESDNPSVQKLLADLAKQVPELPGRPVEFRAYDETLPTDHECPKCGFKWSGGKPSSS